MPSCRRPPEIRSAEPASSAMYNGFSYRMSMTPVPISIRLVLAPTAASSGNGDANWRAKWWTLKYAPSAPSSSAATASSMDWASTSAADLACEPSASDQCPNERNPIFFTYPPTRSAPRLFPSHGRPRPAPLSGYRVPARINWPNQEEVGNSGHVCPARGVDPRGQPRAASTRSLIRSTVSGSSRNSLTRPRFSSRSASSSASSAASQRRMLISPMWWITAITMPNDSGPVTCARPAVSRYFRYSAAVGAESAGVGSNSTRGGWGAGAGGGGLGGGGGGGGGGAARTLSANRSR